VKLDITYFFAIGLRDEYLDRPDEIAEFKDKLQQLKDFYETKVSYKVERKKKK